MLVETELVETVLMETTSVETMLSSVETAYLNR